MSFLAVAFAPVLSPSCEKKLHAGLPERFVDRLVRIHFEPCLGKHHQSILFSLELSVLALLSLLLAVELDAEDDDPLVELDEASLDSDDVEDESLPSLESFVSLSLLLFVVLFENETLLSELSGA